MAHELGRRGLGLAALILGAAGLRFGAFATVWQPAPADWPKGPAYLAAAAALVAGAGLMWRRTAAVAASIVAAYFALFAILWAGRVAAAPGVFGTWLGFAEELGAATGALLCLTRALGEPPVWAERVALWVFAACVAAFGAAHLIYVSATAAFVPAWLPGRPAWAVLTGLADQAGAFALASGLARRPAGRLLATMYLGFGLLVWAPQVAAHAGQQTPWAGFAVTLALAAAAWIASEGVPRRAPEAASAGAALGGRRIWSLGG